MNAKIIGDQLSLFNEASTIFQSKARPTTVDCFVVCQAAGAECLLEKVVIVIYACALYIAWFIIDRR